MEGHGVDIDTKASSMWLKRAAKFGEADAIYNEGLLHLDTPAVAVDYFKRAVEAGSHIAYFNLGVAYQRGAGVPVDLDEAARYFIRDGGADASARLAELYKDSTGTRGPDPASATKWLARACTLGSAPSCFELAEADASSGNMSKAAGWLEKAAEHGDKNAAAQLNAFRASRAQPKVRSSDEL